MLVLFNRNKLLKLDYREEKIGLNEWIYFPLYSFAIWKGNILEKKDTDYFYMRIFSVSCKRYLTYSKALISFSRKYLGFGESSSVDIPNIFPKIPKDEILYIKEYEVLKPSLDSYFQDKEKRNIVFRVKNKSYDCNAIDVFNLAQYKQIHFDKNLSEKLRRDFFSFYENITSYVHGRIEEILEEKEIDPLVIIIS